MIQPHSTFCGANSEVTRSVSKFIKKIKTKGIHSKAGTVLEGRAAEAQDGVAATQLKAKDPLGRKNSQHSGQTGVTTLRATFRRQFLSYY